MGYYKRNRKHTIFNVPDFNKDFILYTFSLGTRFVVILTWKKDEGNEFPIEFMISRLQGVELNYPKVDK
jgi:hypothetical protein